VVKAARRAACTLFALVVFAALISAQSLTIDTVGDALKIRAPGFSFLKGEPVARLKDGRSVRVELAAMVLPAPGKQPAAVTRRLFALSYDLWEERFAVTTTEARAESVSHLTLAAAEAWCVEQLTIPLTSLGALGRDLPFWMRLEYRLVDADGVHDEAESGYTLQALIDLLSRRRKPVSSESGQGPTTGSGQADPPHAIEAGPFRTPARRPPSPR
jgi:hypothetical protein